jgi:hypothetical protein
MFATLIIILSVLLFFAGIGLLITFAILRKKMWTWISAGMVVAGFILFAVGLGMATVNIYNAVDESETTAVEVSEESSDEESASEPTQEELNQQLKENAQKGDFVEINGGQVEEGEQIYLEGTVSLVTTDSTAMPEYDFKPDDSSGGGYYAIKDLSLNGVPAEGEKLKIYGTYSGKQDGTGIPQLTVIVVEEK